MKPIMAMDDSTPQKVRLIGLRWLFAFSSPCFIACAGEISSVPTDSCPLPVCCVTHSVWPAWGP
jgi:hypothetical protein